jgi:ATP synthase F1 subcomplex epsilon subunit
MASIHVDIVAAEGDLHHGEAKMVFAPAMMGEVGIAPRHAPLLTRLKAGEVRVQPVDGEELHFFVGGGVLEVQPHLVTIMADTGMRAKDLDEVAAAEAKRRAEERLSNANNDLDIARAQSELAQAAALVAYLQKIRRHGG